MNTPFGGSNNSFSTTPSTSSPGRPQPVQISGLSDSVKKIDQPQFVTMNKLPSEATPMVGVTSSSPLIALPQQTLNVRQPLPSTVPGVPTQVEGKVLDKRRLQELVKEVDPMEQMDEDVEEETTILIRPVLASHFGGLNSEVLLNIADDFIDSVVASACQIAKHRKSNVLEVKDVQLHLERNWNLWIPGFGSDELRPYKKSSATEAHKQRMALIRKTLKKY